MLLAFILFLVCVVLVLIMVGHANATDKKMEAYGRFYQRKEEFGQKNNKENL